MLRTKVYGEQRDIVIIETDSSVVQELKCKDAIVKLRFSDGAVLGIKYGKDSKLYQNIWHIRVLNSGQLPFICRQCYRETLLDYSDVYETDAELVDYDIICKNLLEEN